MLLFPWSKQEKARNYMSPSYPGWLTLCSDPASVCQLFPVAQTLPLGQGGGGGGGGRGERRRSCPIGAQTLRVPTPHTWNSKPSACAHPQSARLSWSSCCWGPLVPRRVAPARLCSLHAKVIHLLMLLYVCICCFENLFKNGTLSSSSRIKF